MTRGDPNINGRPVDGIHSNPTGLEKRDKIKKENNKCMRRRKKTEEGGVLFLCPLLSTGRIFSQNVLFWSTSLLNTPAS
jgi:hypothetical protein